jgi:hypothetical protein
MLDLFTVKHSFLSKNQKKNRKRKIFDSVRYCILGQNLTTDCFIF